MTKIQEISKPRSAESLKKESQYKENENMARLFSGCTSAIEKGGCLKSVIGCHKCNKNDSYTTAMAMAFHKDKKYKLEIDDLLKRLHEAEEREKIARKIINDKNNELNELRK